MSSLSFRWTFRLGRSRALGGLGVWGAQGIRSIGLGFRLIGLIGLGFRV